LGWAAGNDGATAAAVTTIADHRRDTTLTAPIAERDRTMHHWPRKKIRRMGNDVYETQFFSPSLF
jgi:hypothetical protein